jgi:hypothetical protein
VSRRSHRGRAAIDRAARVRDRRDVLRSGVASGHLLGREVASRIRRCSEAAEVAGSDATDPETKRPQSVDSQGLFGWLGTLRNVLKSGGQAQSKEPSVDASVAVQGTNISTVTPKVTATVFRPKTNSNHPPVHRLDIENFSENEARLPSRSTAQRRARAAMSTQGPDRVARHDHGAAVRSTRCA